MEQLQEYQSFLISEVYDDLPGNWLGIQTIVKCELFTGQLSWLERMTDK